MVSTMSLFAATATAVVCLFSTHVDAHGYTLIPEAVPLVEHKKDKKISSWIVQIEPQFIDSKLYGADCEYSDPKADPKTSPSDGTATFSRGIAHHGPCEIWLDDKMVLHDDDCEKTFGTADYMTHKSVLKPIDYSSCSTSGCMYRFYWIAFQGSDNGYVRQIYRHCVPLTGPPAGQASTAITSAGSAAPNMTQTSTDNAASEAAANKAHSNENDAPKGTEATVMGTDGPATATLTSAATPAANEKRKAPHKPAPKNGKATPVGYAASAGVGDGKRAYCGKHEACEETQSHCQQHIDMCRVYGFITSHNAIPGLLVFFSYVCGCVCRTVEVWLEMQDACMQQKRLSEYLRAWFTRSERK
ncbi:hypothetical protein F441_15398 [Phytophthora nicotianae CJ01A1]|uniref:Uncharacterized protein n=1 Tax=Phytophthora nicotianae CJ01A1 TaxID=1317063 RepID=W2WE86_PHYNI|nr:hypothetical protein F441_15398 [Phytophthora nicotianae CJ01A1]